MSGPEHTGPGGVPDSNDWSQSDSGSNDSSQSDSSQSDSSQSDSSQSDSGKKVTSQSDSGKKVTSQSDSGKKVTSQSDSGKKGANQENTRPPVPPPEAPGFSLERVRRALVNFVLGRLAAGLCGALATILAVRWLEPGAYGTYAVLLGLVIALGGLSSLGVRDVAQRFLPELQVRGQHAQLASLAWRFLHIRVLTLALTCAALVALADWLATVVGLSAYAVGFHLLPPVLACMTMANFTCLLLETLLLQHVVKWLWMLMSVLRLAIMIWGQTQGGGLTLEWALLAEGGSCAVATVAGLYCLARRLRAFSGAGGVHEKTPLGPALWQRMLRFGLYNYLLVAALMLQGSAVNKFVAAAVLPVAALAAFSFAQTMADMLQRYMPFNLFLNLVRPTVMARYAQSGDWRDTLAGANLFYKLNLFLLAPIVAGLAAGGTPLARLLSGGRYPDAGPLLACLAALLVLQCHYRRMELVAHALERTGLLFTGNLFVVASMAPAAWLAQWWGVWGIVAAAAGGLACRDAFILIGLARGGWRARNDWRGMARLSASGVAGGLAAWPLAHMGNNPVSLVAAGLACVAVFLVAARLLRPFGEREREVVNGYLGRKLFVW